jgi:hypothetical protein
MFWSVVGDVFATARDKVHDSPQIQNVPCAACQSFLPLTALESVARKSFFLALEEGLHELPWHQLHVVAKGEELMAQMALSGLFEQARDTSAKGANADIARNGSTNAHSNGSKLCAFMSTRLQPPLK